MTRARFYTPLCMFISLGWRNIFSGQPSNAVYDNRPSPNVLEWNNSSTSTSNPASARGSPSRLFLLLFFWGVL